MSYFIIKFRLGKSRFSFGFFYLHYIVYLHFLIEDLSKIEEEKNSIKSHNRANVFYVFSYVCISII